MTPEVLTLRRLNRTTLARQMLLERVALPVEEAVARLVGLQAQLAMPPFVGLWARVAGLRREEVAGAIGERRLVKATFFRATLHLTTARDFRRFRTTIQPALSAASESRNTGRGVELDLEPLMETAREFIAQQPRTFAELTAMFTARHPDSDVRAMRYAVRTHLPMVQVPVEGGWSYPSGPSYTLAGSWLDELPDAEDRLEELLHRYLAAFGPATAGDFQTWSGLRLRERIEDFRSGLVTYRDESRRELFDLPNTSLVSEDTEVPVRFLPDFDNLLLAHQKRTRVIADEHRSRVYLPGLRVAATFLVDGFVAGTWKVAITKKLATLEIQPFSQLPAAAKESLAEEATGLIRFVAPGAGGHEVRFL